MYSVTLFCLSCFVNIAIYYCVNAAVALLVTAQVSLIDASPFHDFFVVPTSVSHLCRYLPCLADSLILNPLFLWSDFSAIPSTHKLQMTGGCPYTWPCSSILRPCHSFVQSGIILNLVGTKCASTTEIAVCEQNILLEHSMGHAQFCPNMIPISWSLYITFTWRLAFLTKLLQN